VATRLRCGGKLTVECVCVCVCVCVCICESENFSEATVLSNLIAWSPDIR